MTESASSSTETALENQRIGGLQLRVATLCALVQVCDGYDVNAISVPSLTHDWNLPGPAFTQAFLWSSIGIMARQMRLRHRGTDGLSTHRWRGLDSHF